MQALIIIDMGAPRSADDVHYMALSNLDGEYAAIVDTASLLGTFKDS